MDIHPIHLRWIVYIIFFGTHDFAEYNIMIIVSAFKDNYSIFQQVHAYGFILDVDFLLLQKSYIYLITFKTF